jgi:hypothetical protein
MGGTWQRTISRNSADALHGRSPPRFFFTVQVRRRTRPGRLEVRFPAACRWVAFVLALAAPEGGQRSDSQGVDGRLTSLELSADPLDQLRALEWPELVLLAIWSWRTSPTRRWPVSSRMGMVVSGS